MNAGDVAMEHQDNQAALREYGQAERLVAKQHGIPHDRRAEMLYWHAVALVNMKRIADALPLFKQAFDLHEGWRELTPRLSEAGLLPQSTRIIRRIVTVR
jgi:hypothetical protein